MYPVRFASPLALVSLSLVSAMAVAACTAGTNGTFGSFGNDGGLLTAGDGGTATGSSGSGGGKKTADCVPDPSCDRGLCECADGTVMATDGICLPGGSCDMVDRCTAACGSSTYSDFVVVEKACDNEGETCFVAQPNVSCQCNEGYGVDTYPRCTNGHCSTAPMNACPASCASEGGWTCQSAADCTPVVCACKDGTYPATGGECDGSSCEPSSAVCPSACTSHGGWDSTGSGSSTTHDAGTTGPKSPGSACTQASECAPFDCSCNDGSAFDGIRSCDSHTCASQDEACSTACLSSGGWSGF
jgi:hypothetical protein